MSPNHATVQHHIFYIRIVSKVLKHLLPYPSFAPPVKALVDAVPVTVPLRQKSPLRPRTHYPQHPFDKPSAPLLLAYVHLWALIPTATPNEVLTHLVSRWAEEIPGLSLATPTPPIELRGAEGPVIPYVLFLSVQQTVGQSLSILEWLNRFFDIFEGYSYRLSGDVLTVIPPMYMQTESIDLTPAATGTPGTLVLSENITTSEDGVINSQSVSHRPKILNGEFLKNPDDGTPADFVPATEGQEARYANLPEIGEPAFYRQGDTGVVLKPADRRFVRNGVPTPYQYSEDKYPELTTVRVSFTCYVFQSFTVDAENSAVDLVGDALFGEEDLGSKLSGKKAIDVSKHLVQQTHVVDLGVGPNARPFDAVFRWVNGTQSAAWVWRLKATPKGVKATLIEPAGSPILVRAYYPVPWVLYLIPVVGFALGFLAPPIPATMGAEFHLNVQGQAWEPSDVTYSATYGVYTPPTLPPGLKTPPFDNLSDAATDATEAIYGRKPGADKVIDIWSLVSSPTTTTAELSEAQKDANETLLREQISHTLLNIAQHTVKERLLPYEIVTLTFMQPFPVTARDIGRMATYKGKTGIIRSYSYSENHTAAGSDITLTITLRVPQTAERQPIIFIPPTPEPEPEPFIPPGYPPSGDFAPPSKPTELPPTSPITAGPGMVQLDFGRRFDLLRIKAAGERRVRLYRTDAARTADVSRPLTETNEQGFTVNTRPAEEVFEQLILEARLPYGENDSLDLHAVLGHTPEGVVYANIEGGPVTFFRFIPRGILDTDPV